MALWEREIFPYHDQLERLAPSERLRVAVEAIDWTLRTMATPIEDPEARQWLDEMLDEARAAVAQRASRVPMPEDLLDRFDEVDDDTEEYGVPQLLMGMPNLWGLDVMTVELVEGVLYNCYAFSSMREEPEPETLDDEQADARCREVIDYQKDLIAQAAS